MIDQSLKDIEINESLCPRRGFFDLVDHEGFLNVCVRCSDWREDSDPPLSGGLLRAIELGHAVRLLHSQRPSRDVDLRYLKGLGVAVAWRADTGEFLGVQPGFVETEYFRGELLITNPQWPGWIRGEHLLRDGHAFAAELRKLGVEIDGDELQALLDAGLGDRLLEAAQPDPYASEGGDA